MNARFAATVARAPEIFRQLEASEPLDLKSIGRRKAPGLYAFFENGVCVHVGRTRDIAQRVRSHRASSHLKATFAFKRARSVLGRVATYTKLGSRGHLMSSDEVFAAEFRRQVALVAAMTVKFVEVEDPLEQHFAEAYCALEWGLDLSEFSTH